MTLVENSLDQLRIARKKELESVRDADDCHSINGDFSFGRESYWLEKDSGFISRGLPLFGNQEHARLPFNRRWSQKFDYEFAQTIIQHLDQLVQQRNPDEQTERNDLPLDSILDMGCGRGIALGDIWAYYDPVLNLYLKGNTGHNPGYQKAFLKRGIEIFQGRLTDEGLENKRPQQGYALIMASHSMIYYENPLPFVQFAAERLSLEGIFPVNIVDVFGEDLEIVDKGNQRISTPQDYLSERFAALGWRQDGDLLVVKNNPLLKLGLTYIPQQEASQLPFYDHSKPTIFTPPDVPDAPSLQLKNYFAITAA